MVDRQTPTVEADAETEREAEAVREGDTSAARPAEAEREAAPEQVATAAPSGRRDDEVEADVDATHEASVRREIDRELGHGAPATNAGTGSSTSTIRSADQSNAALFDTEASKDLQERWLNIQTAFVDEPGKAVEQAEALVGEVMTQLTESFARERRDLQARWSGHDDVSTEDLRQAIRRYRSFFNRLLAV